jgi:chorismate mutase
MEVSSDVPQEIVNLRRSIDNIDAAMVYLLAQRFQLTGQIGEIKAAVGLPSTDRAREQRQMKRLAEIAQEAGLDVNFAQAFREFVTAEVIRHHDHIKATTHRLSAPLPAVFGAAPAVGGGDGDGQFAPDQR